MSGNGLHALMADWGFLTNETIKERLPKIQALLDAGHDPNGLNAMGFTPLGLLGRQVPAVMGACDIARVLLAAGANPLIHDRALGCGDAPFYMEIVDGLRKQAMLGNMLKAEDGSGPFHILAQDNPAALMDCIVDKFTAPRDRGWPAGWFTWQNDKGQTALHCFAQHASTHCASHAQQRLPEVSLWLITKGFLHHDKRLLSVPDNQGHTCASLIVAMRNARPFGIAQDDDTLWEEILAHHQAHELGQTKSVEKARLAPRL